jgi:membrane protease YdiL (CAAX protease family)
VTSDDDLEGSGAPGDLPPGDDPPAPSRPGLTTFTIEGRSAPALFVVGWLASILGGGALLIGYQAPRSVVASVLILVGFALLSIGLVAAAGSQAIERRARGVAGYTGPSPFLLLGASVAASTFLATLVGLLANVLGASVDGPLGTLILLAVVQATYLGLTHLLVVGTGALSWTEMGFRGSVRDIAGNLLWGASFAVPVIGLTLVVTTILALFVSAVPESPLPPTGTTEGLLLNLLGGAVLVPIGEEILFRGVATTAWRRVYGSLRAVVQGGLFFAIVHVMLVAGAATNEAFALALVAFAGRIPVAFALGWLFESRRSIWAPIGLHAAYNGVLITLAHLALTSPAT